MLTLGIRKQYHLVAALIRAVCDTFLILLGVAGVGTALASNPQLAFYAGWGGALFLFWYGSKSLISVFKKESLTIEVGENQSLRTVISTTLAITLLNPHVYLNTIVLLGSISSQYPAGDRALFALGASSASFLWFSCSCL